MPPSDLRDELVRLSAAIERLAALLDPALAAAVDTKSRSVSTTAITIDLSEWVGRLVWIQSSATIAAAWGPTGHTPPTASLTADSGGGARVPQGVMLRHRVTSDRAVASIVADATARVWISAGARVL